MSFNFSYFLIIRPINALITASCIIAGVWIIEAESSVSVYLSTALAGFFSASAGNVINDIYDLSIDRSNNNMRPLVSGRIQIREARIYYFILFLLSQVVSLMSGIVSFFVVLVANYLLYIYSRFLSALPLLGNIVISFLASLAFIYPGLILGKVIDVVYPALFAFLSTLIRELIKDIQDRTGDEKLGRKTFPIVFGMKKTRVLISAVYCILLLITFLPFLGEYYKIEYFLLVMTCVNPLILYSITLLFRENYSFYLQRASMLMKVAMVMGLTAILAGV